MRTSQIQAQRRIVLDESFMEEFGLERGDEVVQRETKHGIEVIPTEVAERLIENGG